MTFIIQKYSSLFTFSLTCWLINTNTVLSQDYQYFNNRYDLNGSNDIDRCYNILETADGYVIGGNTIVVSGNIYWWETFFTKIDFNGDIVYTKYFEEDSVNYFFSSYPGSIILDSNKFYSICVRRTPTPDWVHDEAILMQLDVNLDTVWTKRFGEHAEPYDTAFWFTSINKIQADKLIIAGLWKPIGLASYAYIMMVDEFGQCIWDRSYNAGAYTQSYSVAQTSDQGFILGCGRYTPGYNETLDPIIIKTDSSGNQIWIKNLGSDFMDNKAMVCISADSMIVVGTNYSDSMYTDDAAYSKISISKINNEGNIIWNKKYGASLPNNYLLNIRALKDSSILAVGSIRKYNPEPDWVGWMLKITANGDSLWYREYDYLHGQESENYLYDVIPTSDNGFIACGYVDPYPPDTGSTDTWVIKLDSIGCDSAGCDTTVGIKDDDKTGRLYDVDKSNLDIWPNPASGIVDCRLPIVDLRGDWTLMIYDIFGREVLAPYTPSPAMGEGRGGGWQGWRLDVSALPTGIYFISILQDGWRVAGGKLIVSRS